MANRNWTLIDGKLDTLKSANYCNLKGSEMNSGLTLRGEAVTAKMIRYLNGATWVDNDDPFSDLVEAALTQTTFEYKQRETPGLSQVNYKDGTVTKMATDGQFLKVVKDTLDHYRRITIVETSSDFS